MTFLQFVKYTATYLTVVSLTCESGDPVWYVLLKSAIITVAFGLLWGTGVEEKE